MTTKIETTNYIVRFSKKTDTATIQKKGTMYAMYFEDLDFYKVEKICFRFVGPVLDRAIGELYDAEARKLEDPITTTEKE